MTNKIKDVEGGRKIDKVVILVIFLTFILGLTYCIYSASNEKESLSNTIEDQIKLLKDKK